MATHIVTRSLLLRKPQPTLLSLLSRSLSTLSPSSSIASSKPPSLSALLCFHQLRPLSAVVSAEFRRGLSPTLSAARCFATRTTSSSLNDPNPNWSNRPPKETILLDGCDFEHWLVVMEKPEGDPTRDEIIDKYIKTLAMVVGSEEAARMKIYSVSTRCYYAFGALVDEETSYKIKELPGVRWVLPDSYLDVKNKDYGGEPFINGQAVPYDPKYHEEWIRNNARANERNRRNDRPRNFDRSRNFERRRENIQTQGNPGMQHPPPNAGGMPSNAGGMPPNNMGGMAPNSQGGMPPPNMGGMPPNNIGSMPPRSMGGMAPPNMGGMPPQNNMGGMPPHNNMGGAPPQNNFGQMPPQNNMGGMPPPNMGGMPPNNMGGYQPSQGWSNNVPQGANNVPQGAAGNSPNFQNQNYPPAGVPGRNTYSS